MAMLVVTAAMVVMAAAMVVAVAILVVMAAMVVLVVMAAGLEGSSGTRPDSRHSRTNHELSACRWPSQVHWRIASNRRSSCRSRHRMRGCSSRRTRPSTCRARGNRRGFVGNSNLRRSRRRKVCNLTGRPIPAQLLGQPRPPSLGCQ